MAASNMVADWKAAKKVFEKVTGEKRPKETFLKLFTKDSGIEPALKKCDELANLSPKDRKADSVAKLKAAVADMEKKVADYIVLLDKGMANEPAKNDMYRALKALKTSTDRFKPHYDIVLLEWQTKNPLDLVNTIGLPTLKKVIATALGDIQRVLAKPDQPTYDAVMGGGNGIGRRTATALQALTGSDMDVAGYKKRLDAYATGSKMTISAQATREQVTAEIKNFQAIVKDIARDLQAA